MDPVVQVGDVIQSKDSKKGIVIKLGRGQVRSALVCWEGTQKVKIQLEIDFWMQYGFTVYSRKPENQKWAKAYYKAHKNVLPEV